jgi:NAD(P)-dependent dehydrogenase (short-subunit alcohol dehydrogenase family)
MPIAGRTVLVTGANRGIGLEACRQLKAAGFSVILTARDAATGKAAAEELDVAFSRLDVTSDDDIAAVADGLSRQGDGLDVLINNAAVSLDGFDARVVEQTLAVNFFGALNLTEALLPLMNDGGAIVMVSSGMGELDAYGPELRARFADPRLTRDQLVALANEFAAGVKAGTFREAGWPASAYRVSKASVIALAKLYARDLAPRHIAVNAVCPGWVRTRMGGHSAPRSVEQGAASVVWAATPGEATGGFFRDGRPATW